MNDKPSERGPVVRDFNVGDRDVLRGGQVIECLEVFYEGRRKTGRWIEIGTLEPAEPHPELGMPCAAASPHEAHVWQMSATGYCACPGIAEPTGSGVAS